MMRFSGFTLIELMVTVGIIGILATIALPSYTSWVQRAKYAEVVNAANGVKQQVVDCATSLRTLTGCSAGLNGINANVANPTLNVANIATAALGVITITGNATVFGSAYTYILTPTYTSTFGVTWVKSGTCIAAMMCQ